MIVLFNEIFIFQRQPLLRFRFRHRNPDHVPTKNGEEGVRGPYPIPSRSLYNMDGLTDGDARTSTPSKSPSVRPSVTLRKTKVEEHPAWVLVSATLMYLSSFFVYPLLPTMIESLSTEYALSHLYPDDWVAISCRLATPLHFPLFSVE